MGGERVTPQSEAEELTGRLIDLLEREFEANELGELLQPYAGRAVIAFEAPAYQLKSHRQMGVTWLRPSLKEQHLREAVVQPSWMREGVEIIYAETALDADGNRVIVGDFYVEDGRPIAVKLDEVEDLKVTKIFDKNQFDEASDRYDDNILRLASND